VPAWCLVAWCLVAAGAGLVAWCLVAAGAWWPGAWSQLVPAWWPGGLVAAATDQAEWCRPGGLVSSCRRLYAFLGAGVCTRFSVPASVRVSRCRRPYAFFLWWPAGVFWAFFYIGWCRPGLEAGRSVCRPRWPSGLVGRFAGLPAVRRLLVAWSVGFRATRPGSWCLVGRWPAWLVGGRPGRVRCRSFLQAGILVPGAAASSRPGGLDGLPAFFIGWACYVAGLVPGGIIPLLIVSVRLV
jgi:hypothetical protein